MKNDMPVIMHSELFFAWFTYNVKHRGITGMLSLRVVIILLVVMNNSKLLSAQGNINLHSITTERQPFGSGDEGYTLDGIRMEDGARIKLEDQNNFGPSGTYNKTITITDDYAASGSLEFISASQDIDLFYFGTFNQANYTLNQFTGAELDSLYNWSSKGGKMIIGAAGNDLSFPYPYATGVLNARWNFKIDSILEPQTPVLFLPTAAGKASTIFNGPFGTVDSAFQGGTVQGYFSTLPAEVVILAEYTDGNVTLFLDCKTLDLVLADGDGHNDLGGVTFGENISSLNDKFWANTIAYMDSLQDPPMITQAGNQLSTGAYTNYQWFLNGDSIQGATSSSITITQSGAYSVTADLECGCKAVSSGQAAFYVVGVNDPFADVDISIHPNPVANDGITFKGVDQTLFVSVFDLTGRLIDNFDINRDYNQYSTYQLPTGSYLFRIEDARGNVIDIEKLFKQ